MTPGDPLRQRQAAVYNRARRRLSLADSVAGLTGLAAVAIWADSLGGWGTIAALALGLPRWKVILRIVVPTAGPGIFTAVMLAVARGLGETAPILLTALGNDFINTNIMQPTDAVPLRVYNYAQTAILSLHALAWGGAICLLAIVLALSISARALSSRQQRRVR